MIYCTRGSSHLCKGAASHIIVIGLTMSRFPSLLIYLMRLTVMVCFDDLILICLGPVVSSFSKIPTANRGRKFRFFYLFLRKKFQCVQCTVSPSAKIRWILLIVSSRWESLGFLDLSLTLERPLLYSAVSFHTHNLQ
jgi:hypothetical protein